MKYFSLFSGIGGFELGIQQAYEKTLGTINRIKDGRGEEYETNDDEERDRLESEAWEDTCSKKRLDGEHFNGEPDEGEPTCIGYSEIDKYAIQVYSKHFQHKNYGDITRINERHLPDFELICGGFPCQSFSIAGKRRGFEDTRGTLFFDIARIVNHKRPRLIFLENVKGLLSHDGGRTFATIIATLDGMGYDLQWQVLNSKDFGVPQNRERVFIVGHLRGTPRPKVFPFTENNSEDIVLPTITTRVTADSNGTYVGKRSPRQTSDMKIRRLTPTECERLQGFPDNWTDTVNDTQRYKCLGNAVTINVIREIANKLL